MATHTATLLSPDERQRLLLDAAEKYLRGEIKDEQFKKAERTYLPDYRVAMQALISSQSIVFGRITGWLMLLPGIVSLVHTETVMRR
jgi:hypothetical protein